MSWLWVKRHQQAAKAAIDQEFNQYAITHGSPNFRNAIAEKVRSYNRIPCDPDLNITVTCGATEAMIATMLAVINPGDEVIFSNRFTRTTDPTLSLPVRVLDTLRFATPTSRSIGASWKRHLARTPVGNPAALGREIFCRSGWGSFWQALIETGQDDQQIELLADVAVHPSGQVYCLSG